MNVTNPRLLDLKAAFEALPKKGRDVTFAGGCQVIGDCLVVPAETGTGKSSVMFFDVTVARTRASSRTSRRSRGGQS